MAGKILIRNFRELISMEKEKDTDIFKYFLARKRYCVRQYLSNRKLQRVFKHFKPHEKSFTDWFHHRDISFAKKPIGNLGGLCLKNVMVQEYVTVEGKKILKDSAYLESDIPKLEKQIEEGRRFILSQGTDGCTLYLSLDIERIEKIVQTINLIEGS